LISFDEISDRKVKIHHEGHAVLIELSPGWNVVALAFGTAAGLWSLYSCYSLTIILFHFRERESTTDFAIQSFVALLSIAMGAKIAHYAAWISISKELIRADSQAGELTVVTRIWKFSQTVALSISEIRNLHAERSNWIGRERNLGVVFYHGKHGYCLAQGACKEDRAKIVRLLESAGVSTLDKSVQSTSSYSP
jgi:hypothetical protein